MARKIIIGFFVFFILLCFWGSSFATSLGYGSIADYYSNVFVFQNGNQISSVTYPVSDSPAIDYSCSFIGTVNGGVVYFVALVENTSNYSGYISYSSTPKPSVTNYTNINYSLFYASTNSWTYFRTLAPNETFTYSENSWYSEDTPFPFVGSNVLIRYNNQGAYLFSNYVSSTLRITSLDSDIENGGIDYPVIFDNAQLNIGLNNLKSYVAVSYQASNDSSTWADMSYVILTNNTDLYKDTTHSFYITLQNLIDRDLAVGDKIKIEYGWTTLDRLGNPHSYSFYQIYTRSTAYIDGSAYEPPPTPGTDEPSGNEDITNSLTEQTQAINDQTNAINSQTDSINEQTNVISGMNDQLFNENTTNPSSIDIQDNTQNNTADLSSFFNTIQTAFTTRDSQDKIFTLTLPNGDSFQLVFPKAFIRGFITGNQALYTFVSAFWYIVFGCYIIFDMKRMYNKFKNGDFEGAMNSSSVDNVVKEALR